MVGVGEPTAAANAPGLSAVSTATGFLSMTVSKVRAGNPGQARYFLFASAILQGSELHAGSSLASPAPGRGPGFTCENGDSPRSSRGSVSGVCTSLTSPAGLAQDRAKAFLLEMHIIGQHIGDAFPPHGLHRDAT